MIKFPWNSEEIRSDKSFKTNKNPFIKRFTFTIYNKWTSYNRERKHGHFQKAKTILQNLIKKEPDNLIVRSELEKMQLIEGHKIINQIKQQINEGMPDKKDKVKVIDLYEKMYQAINHIGIDNQDIQEILNTLSGLFPFFLEKRLILIPKLETYARQMQGHSLDFDRYLIKEILSAHQYGATFKCLDKKKNQDCIIKMLPGMYGRQGLLEEKMINAVKQIHIAPKILENFAFADDHFIVMEFIKGITLQEAMLIDPQKKFQDKNYVLDKAVQICAAINEIHRYDICHLDIKPGNIIISQDLDGNETIRIIDFGIAQLIQNKSTNSFNGTPGYTAPELPDNFSFQSDIFSLGATIWEMIGNKLKASGPDIDMRFNLTELEKIAATACRKKPLERYSSVALMLHALKSCSLNSHANITSCMPLYEKDIFQGKLMNINEGTVTYLGMQFKLHQFMIDKDPVTTNEFDLFAGTGLYDLYHKDISPVLIKRIWTRPGLEWLKNSQNTFFLQTGKDEVWYKPVTKICLYECMAFCNWRSIMAYDPALMIETKTRELVPKLEKILLYDMDGHLVTGNISGFRLPTEFELEVCHLTTRVVGKSFAIYEYTTSSFLNPDQLKPYCNRDTHPVPYRQEINHGLIVNNRNERIPVSDKSEVPAYSKPVFRCTLQLHDLHRTWIENHDRK